MVQSLPSGNLKTGEQMKMLVVIPPDQHYQPQVFSLLGHKDQQWQYHFQEAFAGNVQALETRFYLGLIDDDPICNIMTTEFNRVGTLGHVYTQPEHRRKGACSLLMATQMEDWRRRGGGILLLATEFDSPPYWIYHSFGFRSVTPGSGLMSCATEDDFQQRYFAPAAAKVVEYQWSAWPRLNLLSASPQGDLLRSLSFGRFGSSSFESAGVTLKKRLDQEPQVKAKLLESDSGAIVGWIFLLPDSRWPGLSLLDLFLHPNFANYAPSLLQSLPLPPGKCQCYLDTPSSARAAALQAAGFRQEALLHAQFLHQRLPISVAIYSKSV